MSASGPGCILAYNTSTAPGSSFLYYTHTHTHTHIYPPTTLHSPRLNPKQKGGREGELTCQPLDQAVSWHTIRPLPLGHCLCTPHTHTHIYPPPPPFTIQNRKEGGRGNLLVSLWARLYLGVQYIHCPWVIVLVLHTHTHTHTHIYPPPHPPPQTAQGSIQNRKEGGKENLLVSLRARLYRSCTPDTHIQT